MSLPTHVTHPTARGEYIKVHGAAMRLLRIIKAQMKEYDEGSRQHRENWGYAGDLKFVVHELDGIAGFLGAKKP